MSEEEANLPKALFKGELFIGEFSLPCYVLEDERRILVQNAVLPALGLSQGTAGRLGDRLASFVSGKIISSFLDREIIEVIQKPLVIELPGGTKQTAYAYEATILVDICDAVLRAREAGALQKQQEHIARQCEILMRAFARTGIIALIDEATGYQYYRARKALEAITSLYLSEELRKWVKTFPDDFYRELFRLKGWKYSIVPLKRPGVVGHITNDVVYHRLAPGIVERLKELTPKTDKGNPKHRLHQHLSEDVGYIALRDHLTGVIALMRASATWTQFHRNLEKAYPKFNHSEPLFYPDELDALEAPTFTRAGLEDALKRVSKPS